MKLVLPQIGLRGDNITINGKLSNFLIQELIPKKMYDEQRGINRLRFVSASGVLWIQFVRQYFGVAVHVNNWHRGGNNTLRGYRPPQAGYLNHLRNIYGSEHVKEVIKIFNSAGLDTYSMSTGSYYSIHKLAGGFDFTVEGQTANETRQKILDNQGEFMSYGLTTLEDERFAPTWVHGDNRPTGLDEIFIVRPAA